MAYQGNQQTQFIGYPQNQLYNPQDLQYMQDTQKEFMDWGQWQPGMTNVSQWDTNPAHAVNPGPRQQMLLDYYNRVGMPYEQSARQGYWEQMGGQHYGGIIAPTDPFSPFPGFSAYNKLRQPPESPWGTLNNMGISTAYGMPAWQQDFFNSQNVTPGEGQTPTEPFNLANSGSTNMSNYGIPANFNPAQDYTAQQLQNDAAAQNPGLGDPTTPQQTPAIPQAPTTPPWLYPQQQNAWGNNSSNPWGHSGGWGGQGWGH